MQATQAWGNMAQYMRDAITAQGAGKNEAFGAGRLGSLSRGMMNQFGGQGRQARPLMQPVMTAPQQASTAASVVSPGQTQVIRPSAQAARRQGPGAETDTSLLTRQMGPEDVALGMSSLLGG